MRFFILSALLIIGHNVVSQSKPGLYLTMDFDPGLCENILKLINSDIVYCLSEEPLIEPDLFQSVDDIEYDSLFGMRKFRIVLTLKGQDYVTTLARKLPGHDLALVVNGILISIIDLEGIYRPRSIIIWDRYDSQSMEWVHKTLANMVSRNNKKS
jgi:hypothetical protein